MSREGWRGKLTMWRESTLQGPKTGQALAVPGITEARLARSNRAGYAKTGPHGIVTESAAIHASYELTIQREFSLGLWADMVAECLRSEPVQIDTDTPAPGLTTTTRRTRTDTGTPTFGVDFVSGDGQARRLTGCTPNRVEWSINTRRALIQTVTLAVLGNDDLDPEDFTPPDVVQFHQVLSGLNATHYVAGDRVHSFTSQVILDREISAVQFTEGGRPTRWQPATGWRAAGQSTVRLSPTAAAVHGFDVQSAVQAQFWRITNVAAQQQFDLAFDACRFQRLASPIIVGDFIDHGIEWVAVQALETASFHTVTIKP